eukprot:3483759-Amphidinium_carterae.1
MGGCEDLSGGGCATSADSGRAVQEGRSWFAMTSSSALLVCVLEVVSVSLSIGIGGCEVGTLNAVMGQDRLTAHSMKPGGVQWHAKRGMGLWAIKFIGRWASDVVE